MKFVTVGLLIAPFAHLMALVVIVQLLIVMRRIRKLDEKLTAFMKNSKTEGQGNANA